MRRFAHENSLSLFFGAILLAALAAQALVGHDAHNDEQLSHSMVVLSIYLRQRGSPESKPVGERHDSTGTTG